MNKESIVKEIEILRAFFGEAEIESPNCIGFCKGNMQVSVSRVEEAFESYSFHCSAVHHEGPGFDFDFPLDEVALAHYHTDEGNCLRVQHADFVADFYVKNGEPYFFHVCSNKCAKKIVEKIMQPPCKPFEAPSLTHKNTKTD